MKNRVIEKKYLYVDGKQNGKKDGYKDGKSKKKYMYLGESTEKYAKKAISLEKVIKEIYWWEAAITVENMN